jgi:GNAT superfamily N-acetyltransferase
MMAAAEDWLRARGVWKVNLMVRTGNAPVLGFYDALGYVDSGVTVREKWIDESKRFAAKPGPK